MKKAILVVIKLAISAALLGYLARQAARDSSFQDLVDYPKRWEFLALGAAATFASVTLTFLRWWLLVRRLELDCTARQAFRIGFLGYLFNFFSLGVIGGDVLRAVFLARHNPTRKPAAVASVFIDRFLGLYVLFLVAMAGSWCIDLRALPVDNPTQLQALVRLTQTTHLVVLGGALGIAAIFAPGLTAQRWQALLNRIPVVRNLQDRIVTSIDACRQHAAAVILGILLSLVVHVLNVFGIYFVALGLPGDEPSLAAHFIIAPLAILAGTVPLPGGLGAVEYALDFLYRAVSTTAVAARQGFLVALGYRVVTMVIAAIGFGYYLASRGEVTSLIAAAADDSAEAGDESAPAAPSDSASAAAISERTPSSASDSLRAAK